MFTYVRTRAWLSAGAIMLAGLTAGCKHTHHNSCSNCTPGMAAAPASASPKVELKPAAEAPGKATVTAMPADLPINNMPPVSNERYIALDPPKPDAVMPGTVVAEKPKVDTLPPVTAIPPMMGEDRPAPRRSFADITARPEFAHAPDYSSLTGELSFVPQKNQWRLRYTSIDDEDKYGGGVTLDASQQMKGFNTGDLVCVEGRIVDAESREVSPLYRVKEIVAVKK